MSDTLDLGSFTEPLMVFGGPYSNLQATRALLAKAREIDIPPTHMLCTGDVVAYCAEPQETVDMIRDAGIAVVMGNCEESLGSEADDCGCGYEEGSDCDLLAARWYAFSSAALDREAKAWMRGLPRRITLVMADRRLVAIHGGVDRINRFVFPSTPDTEKARELRLSGRDGVIAGHSGLPFTQVLDGRLWHNAGVIGLPANDGTRRVWYSLFRPTGEGILIEHHALDYDHRAAAGRILDNELPAPYAEALDTGFWPADDFMPPADRARRGQHLAPGPVLWM